MLFQYRSGRLPLKAKLEKKCHPLNRIRKVVLILFQRDTRKTATTPATSTIRWGNTPTPQPPSSETQLTKCAHLKGRWKRAARTPTNATMCLKDRVIIMVQIPVAATATMNRSLSFTTAARRTTRNTTGAPQHVQYRRNAVVMRI